MASFRFLNSPGGGKGVGRSAREVNRRIEEMMQELFFHKTTKPQIVANRGMLPGTIVSGTYISTEFKCMVRNGMYAASDICVAFPGFSVNSDASGETPLPNDLIIAAAIEKVSPAKAVICSFNGQKLATIKGGTDLSISNPVGLDFAAYEDFYIHLGQDAAVATNSRLSGLNNTKTGDTTFRSTSITSANWQIGTAGTWSGTSRDTNANVASPAAILGTPSQNYPCVTILGDSIAANRDDISGDALGNHGFIARGLGVGDIAGNSMPYMNLARSGERASTILNGNASYRMAMLRFCSHVIINHGTNDIQQGVTFSALQTSLSAAWLACKRRGVKVYQVLILPRTTSTDNFATAANQSFVSGFAPGGTRDLINAWIKSQVGILLDGIIDPNVYLEDAANPGKWLTNGSANYLTADGTHPVDAGHVAAAPAVSAVSKTFEI